MAAPSHAIRVKHTFIEFQTAHREGGCGEADAPMPFRRPRALSDSGIEYGEGPASTATGSSGGESEGSPISSHLHSPDHSPRGLRLDSCDLSGSVHDVDVDSQRQDGVPAAPTGPHYEWVHAGYCMAVPVAGLSWENCVPEFVPMAAPNFSVHDWERAVSGAMSPFELDIAAAQLAAAARRAEQAARKARKESKALHQANNYWSGVQGSPGTDSPPVAPRQVTRSKATKPHPVGPIVNQQHPAPSSQTPPEDIPEEQKTTVMLRNLPNDYSRDMVLALLDAEGFAGCYDFVYYPVDFRSWAGFGYAFVNLVSHSEAQRVREQLTGYNRWEVPSQKEIEVCWGDPLQGLQSYTDRYRNSPVMHKAVPDRFKPVVFQEGQRAVFPPPTKHLRAPRWKRGCPRAGSASLEDFDMSD